jgi:hypothetical protein
MRRESVCQKCNILLRDEGDKIWMHVGALAFHEAVPGDIRPIFWFNSLYHDGQEKWVSRFEAESRIDEAEDNSVSRCARFIEEHEVLIDIAIWNGTKKQLLAEFARLLANDMREKMKRV